MIAGRVRLLAPVRVGRRPLHALRLAPGDTLLRFAEDGTEPLRSYTVHGEGPREHFEQKL